MTQSTLVILFFKLNINININNKKKCRLVNIVLPPITQWEEVKNNKKTLKIPN